MRNIIHNRFQFSILTLIVIYFVGIVLVLLGYADSLMLLTPVNLLFVAVIMIYNSHSIDKAYLIWFAILALSGYLIELAGIITGTVFGEYSYGSGLGWKLFDVPLIIGINWAVLVFASAAMLQGFSIPRWSKAALSATLMVMYDILLEPVAIRFDFWTWAGDHVPLQNYFAWWVIAFVMLFGTFSFIRNLVNRIAIYIITIQALFFVIVILQQNLSIR